MTIISIAFLVALGLLGYFYHEQVKHGRTIEQEYRQALTVIAAHVSEVAKAANEEVVKARVAATAPPQLTRYDDIRKQEGHFHRVLKHLRENPGLATHEAEEALLLKQQEPL